MTETYHVIVQAPDGSRQTLTLEARDTAHLIESALELVGPGAAIVRCTRAGEWT
jgi:hypothetical protein